jgi:hypothetical protein
MARFFGLVSLLLGLGLTAYFSREEGKFRDRPGSSVDAVHGMEGGDPLPTPRP